MCGVRRATGAQREPQSPPGFFTPGFDHTAGLSPTQIEINIAKEAKSIGPSAFPVHLLKETFLGLGN